MTLINSQIGRPTHPLYGIRHHRRTFVSPQCTEMGSYLFERDSEYNSHRSHSNIDDIATLCSLLWSNYSNLTMVCTIHSWRWISSSSVAGCLDPSRSAQIICFDLTSKLAEEGETTHSMDLPPSASGRPTREERIVLLPTALSKQANNKWLWRRRGPMLYVYVFVRPSCVSVCLCVRNCV